MSQLGVPYRFAAESPGVAFDCSGLTKYAWGQAGVYLPHQSGAQYGSIPHVSQSEIQPGDLIFYKSPIGHVAIYIGGGSMIHAPSHRSGRQGGCRQLGQGRRNRSTRIATGTVSARAGHRHRSGQRVARSQRRRCRSAVRLRPDRRWSVQSDVRGHGRRRSTIRAATTTARRRCWQRRTTWHASTASSRQSVAPSVPVPQPSRCAPTSRSTVHRST